jgi:uncharacterized protein YndB with AHSA1/START domain
MSTAVAEVSIVVAAPRARLWEALTDPVLISEYFMGATVTTDWRVGRPITWAGEWKGKPYEDKGEILEFRPEERLSYSHWSPMSGTDDVPDNYHVVTIELDDVEGGTEVTLTQQNLAGGISESDRSHRAEYEKNWRMVLEGLKKTAEAHD